MNESVSNLQQRLLAAISRGIDAPLTDAEFNRLALELFTFQAKRAGITTPTPAHWKDIPAAPTSVFKDIPVTCFPVAEAVAEFHTSGTTAAKAGKHYFKTLEFYHAAIRPNFAAHLLPDNARLPMFVLTPSPAEAPHSSLSHMMGEVICEFGATDSAYYVVGGQLLVKRLVRDLCEAQWASQPVFLLGTAFAFVHLFDHLAEEGVHFQLPAGSRAMETGGFKGRSREMPKSELYGLFEKFLGLPAPHVVNEYGMTELSTQFYDLSLRRGERTDAKLPPPWARVLMIDPATGKEAPTGQRSLIRVLDLANIWSTVCVQTEDWGISHADGTFEILGRVPEAPSRGCSLTSETWSPV